MDSPDGPTVKVLDKGYVCRVDKLGNDLTPVNAARVSFDKRTKKMTEKDLRLIKFLADNDHTSPFRHAAITFEIYAPLMVARQWYKYVVGSTHDPLFAWNESSRRYVTEEPEFYIPAGDQWHEVPANRKQGSGGPVNIVDSAKLSYRLRSIVHSGKAAYDDAMAMDVAPEQARLFLPAYAMYVRWYWTGSLQAVAHFINQRTKQDAQWEIRQYADAVKELAMEVFPHSIKHLTESK